MDVIKKFGLLIGAGVALILGVLFGFVVGFPTGIEGVTVSQPFASKYGILSEPIDMGDAIRALDTIKASVATLSALSVIFFVVAAALVVVSFVLRARANRPAVNLAAEKVVVSTVPCPFCAEPIQAAAKICKHCNKDIA